MVSFLMGLTALKARRVSGDCLPLFESVGSRWRLRLAHSAVVRRLCVVAGRGAAQAIV